MITKIVIIGEAGDMSPKWTSAAKELILCPVFNWRKIIVSVKGERISGIDSVTWPKINLIEHINKNTISEALRFASDKVDN